MVTSEKISRSGSGPGGLRPLDRREVGIGRSRMLVDLELVPPAQMFVSSHGGPSGTDVRSIGAGETGSGPITLATATVRGESPGETDLSVTSNGVADIENTPYDIGLLRGATLQVEENTGPPPVCPGSSAPTDPDRDGVYEDANGDGSFDIFDVQCLLEQFDSDAVQDNPDAFDITDDGSVDIFDVRAALEQV